MNCPFKGLHHVENGSGKTQCGCSTLIQSLFSSEGQPTPPGNDTGITVGCVLGALGVVVLLVLLVLLVVYIKKRRKGFYHCRCSLLLQTCLPRWAAGRGHDLIPLFIRCIAERDRRRGGGQGGDGGEGGDGGGQTQNGHEM